MSEFFRTRMGQQFFDGAVPRIAKALESIAQSLERQTMPLVEVPPIDQGSDDGVDKLCRALYGRAPKFSDYGGGSQATMLHDAAKAIELRRLDDEAAAGELIIDVPEPGSDAAKLLVANRLLLARIAELEDR